jgi:Protein of unknown function (DUF3618)
MGEDARTGGPAMSTAQGTDNAAREPEEIRQEIDQTRAELGDTVEALAHKTDVKSRVRERLDRGRSSTPQVVRENPVPLAITGVFVVGFIAGRISSR